MMDDEVLARQLQEEYDREAAEHLEQYDEPNQMSPTKFVGHKSNGYKAQNVSNLFLEQYDEPNQMSPTKFVGHKSNGYKAQTVSNLSPVDPSLEFSDPNPDIRILFLQFNEEYFWGRLSGIEVKWSPRMTLCAGLCVYEGFGGLCSVRLSLPLLKLRPRKDLVETLLHEMIHAYLFITNNDRDHDGHGPNFQKHMHRINKATGAHITIYHTFHDEVQAYQQHWWRCNGPCQQRKPFFGYVKRAMNRAPSSNDFWWAEHRATCGGTFTKIKEPEDYGKKKAGAKKSLDKNSGNGIRPFMDKGQASSSSKKLFDTTGKAPSLDKRSNIHGGSIFSKGKSKSSTSVKNKTSSTSNYVVMGGVLVRKPSLKQSSLFTSVGTSNTAKPQTKNSSHSVLFPKDGNKNSVSIHNTQEQNKKVLGNDDTPKTDRSGGKSQYADIFHGSGMKNYKWQNRKQSSPSPDRGVVKLPRNFRSVCEHGGGKKGVVTKKRKKYLFDELDEDDGLWDTDSDLDQGKGKSGKRPGTTDNHLSSMSPVNKKLKDTCKIANQGTSPSSPKVKRDILTEIVPKKLRDNQTSPSKSLASSGKSNFPGQGYRLGHRQHSKSVVTPTKNKIRSSQNTSSGSSSKHRTLDSFLSKEKKVQPEPKRSFDKAFPITVIDISDGEEDEEEEFKQKPSKIMKEDFKFKEEIFTQEFSDNEEDVLGASASVSDACEQASSSGSSDNSSLIPCPVCNAKVFHYGINNHLDMCLGMT